MVDLVILMGQCAQIMIVNLESIVEKLIIALKIVLLVVKLQTPTLVNRVLVMLYIGMITAVDSRI